MSEFKTYFYIYQQIENKNFYKNEDLAHFIIIKACSSDRSQAYLEYIIHKNYSTNTNINEVIDFSLSNEPILSFPSVLNYNQPKEHEYMHCPFLTSLHKHP